MFPPQVFQCPPQVGKPPPVGQVRRIPRLPQPGQHQLMISREHGPPFRRQQIHHLIVPGTTVHLIARQVHSVRPHPPQVVHHRLQRRTVAVDIRQDRCSHSVARYYVHPTAQPHDARCTHPPVFPGANLPSNDSHKGVNTTESPHHPIVI